jgi:cyclic pyranopterin phosphate synthase
MDIALIETMPLGDIEEDRTDQYLPLADVRRDLEKIWTFEETQSPGCGPARYVRVRETAGRLGFITPMTHNFCAGCNRVRLTCTGRLYLCLGQDDHADFRDLLRADAGDSALNAALDAAMARKPLAHDFAIAPGGRPAQARFMSATGG